MTYSLNDLLNFSINLIDKHNQQINFEEQIDEQKIGILDFKIDLFRK